MSSKILNVTLDDALFFQFPSTHIPIGTTLWSVSCPSLEGEIWAYQVPF